MNIIANRSLVGAQAPELSMARDVFRILITAVLAGTGFALLLALTVLSLTVIAPPAQASGGPTLVSSEPDPSRGTGMESPGKQDVTMVLAAGQPAGTPAVAPVNPPRDSTHEGVYESLPKTGTATSAVLYLLLALGAVPAFFAYLLARRRK
jgi:LPXTG-motif cell wall-anchored protein